MTTEFTLHGRPLKVGDKVWWLNSPVWLDVVDMQSEQAQQAAAVGIQWVSEHPSSFAWDEPPAVDLASIPPPLCWIEGHPVRKGEWMMWQANHAVVVNGMREDGLVECIEPCGKIHYAFASLLTFSHPPSKRPMRTVERTVWINKYPVGGTYVYGTEEDAKDQANPDCQGQHPVTYTVEIPE